MTQAPRNVPFGPRAELRANGLPFAPNSRPFSGWLALADPDGSMDLPRLFPQVEIRVEPNSVAFADALAELEPGLVVLIAPPAGPADLQRVALWRAAHHGSCAVLLCPHGAVALRLHALELGFDDAVDLSSDPMEVVGRLSIAGRTNVNDAETAEDRIPIGDGIELDLRARAIRHDGRLMSLRPKELALLEFLARHPGRAFSRDELLHRVWQGAVENERMVDVYVFWLRSKVERDPANPVHLVTVRGSGYLFEPPANSTSGVGSATATAPER
jgi:DNA-binding response OmpR family regulator